MSTTDVANPEIEETEDRFHSEYERDLEQLLRRRFTWLCVTFLVLEAMTVSLALMLFAVVPSIVRVRAPDGPQPAPLIDVTTEPATRDAALELVPPPPPSPTGLNDEVLAAIDAIDALARDGAEEVPAAADEPSAPATVGTPDRGPREAVIRRPSPATMIIIVVSAMTTLLVLLWFLVVVRARLETRDQLVRAATHLIIALSLLQLVFEILLWRAGAHDMVQPRLSLFFWHFLACLFLPWTPRESLRAMAPGFVLWAGWMFALSLRAIWIGDASMWTLFGAFGAIAWTPAIFIPGVLLCAWRLRSHRKRFNIEFTGRQFLAIRRELRQARTVHETLFPEPFVDEHVRFDYEYEPMREIGGDFVHFEREGHRARLILLDVTGHGLTAAMTVNRIAGELDRIRAEHPDAGAQITMRLLNRYIHLTLSRHTIYCTGVMIIVNMETGELEYVNAGHPPVFVRYAGGEIEELGSTTFMLGAVGDDLFDAEGRTLELSPGDEVVAYTDGTIEARDSSGEEFGLDRLRHAIRNARKRESMPRHLRGLAADHARGMLEDDILIAVLRLERRMRARGGPDDDGRAVLAGVRADRAD